MPIITLPDGSKKVFEKSVTILEIAQELNLTTPRDQNLKIF